MGRAARATGLSQPTLSRRLAELEAKLGQALFERTPRGLRLTSAGQALLVPSQRMREQAMQLSRVASTQARSLVGTVRITASEATSAFVLLPLLRQLRETQPQIQIELVPSDAIEDLLERRADIALRMVRPTQPSLIARRLADQPLGLYASRDYLARRGTPTRLTIGAHDWIGMDRQETMIQGFAAAGYPVTREFFGFRCDHSVVQWQAVGAGLGIGVGLKRVAEVSPQVVRVMPDVAIASLPMWLVAHRELRGSRRLRLVFDALAKGLVKGAQDEVSG